MTFEVELKFPLIDLETLEFELISREAKQLEIVIQKDHYFNHPCKDFNETDEAVRIREEADKIVLTYKGSKFDPKSKSRKEINLDVSSLEDALDFLISTGFTEVLIVVKERKAFSYKEAVITLDSIEGLGNFVEIENLIENKEDFEKERNRLFAIAEELSINTKSSIRKSYLELLLEKKSK